MTYQYLMIFNKNKKNQYLMNYSDLKLACYTDLTAVFSS